LITYRAYTLYYPLMLAVFIIFHNVCKHRWINTNYILAFWGRIVSVSSYTVQSILYILYLLSQFSSRAAHQKRNCLCWLDIENKNQRILFASFEKSHLDMYIWVECFRVSMSACDLKCVASCVSGFQFITWREIEWNTARLLLMHHKLYVDVSYGIRSLISSFLACFCLVVISHFVLPCIFEQTKRYLYTHH